MALAQRQPPAGAYPSGYPAPSTRIAGQPGIVVGRFEEYQLHSAFQPIIRPGKATYVFGHEALLRPFTLTNTPLSPQECLCLGSL